MFLYLVRHGEAKNAVDDAARELTDKGIREVSLVAAYARDSHITVGAIYHSGKKRALQTSTIFSEYLKPVKGLYATDGLAPMDEPEEWVKRISGTREDIMLVGHMPYLPRLAGLLLCGDKENMHLDFKTGGIACLQRFDDGRWALEWMITPEMIRH